MHETKHILRPQPSERYVFVFQKSCTEMPRGENSGPKTNPESKSLAFAIAPVTFPKTDKTINDIAASGLVDASPWDVGQTLFI